LTPENCKIIREAILDAAEELQGKLPDNGRHKAGRNPYAHVPKVIKDICGCSYKELPDELIKEVLEIVRYCKENPF